LNWRTVGKACGAIGVTMSAMQIGLLGWLIEMHPADVIYIALQTGVIALGTYAANQSTEAKP